MKLYFKMIIKISSILPYFVPILSYLACKMLIAFDYLFAQNSAGRIWQTLMATIPSSYPI